MSIPRVVVECPVPMPYLFPVFRLVAESGEIELTVLYARRSLAARGNAFDPAALGFPHVFLADAGHVFAGREIREIDFNPGLPRALDRLGPDVVVLSGFVQPTALLGIAWARLRRRPYGLHVESHDLRRRGAARRALRRRLAGGLVRRAAVLYPTGEAAAQSLVGLGGARDRMFAFPHVADPALFHARGRDEAGAEQRARLGIPEDARLLVFVGRLVESKGVQTLLAAQREIHRRTGAQLIVVGTGPLQEALVSSAPPGVLFLGQLEHAEVAAVLRAADIAVSPSLDEPWGTFPLEAAASGCVIVATDRVASAAELVARHGGGRLVRPGDAGALAAAVVALLDSPDELAEISRRARAAAAEYTPERAASSFVQGVRLALGGGMAS